VATYNKGVIDSAAVSEILYQSRGISIDCEKAEAKDNNGNVVAVKYFDHRANVKIDAIIPDGAEIPVPGTAVAIEGVTLPSVSDEGVITGTFKINADATTGVDFAVIGSPEITEANTDYKKVSMELRRHLVHGI